MRKLLKVEKVFLPPYFLEDKKDKVIILRWALIGLLIRVVVMPFSSHNDFLSEHIRVFQIISGKNLFPGIFQFLSHYIDAFFMKIFLPFIPDVENVFALPPSGFTTVEISDFLNFVSAEHIWRTIFILKIPYLIFDYWSLFLILKIMKDKDSAARVFKFWMVNPVIIYSVYIFGRFETYPIFFLILFFYLVEKGKNPFLAFLVFGISIICRGYPLIILPIVLLILNSPWLKRLYYLIISLTPLGIVLIIGRVMKMLNLTYFEHDPTIGGKFLTEGSFLMVLLRPLLNFGEVKISIVVFTYIVIVLILILERKKNAMYFEHMENCYRWDYENQSENFLSIGSVSVYCFIFFLFFYSFANYSAHWFSWVVPFVVVLVYLDKKYLRLFYLLTITWTIYWVFATDIGVFSTYLFTPLGGVYFHDVAANYLTTLHQISFASLEYELVVSSFRGGFVAACFYALWKVIQDMVGKNSEKKV